MSLGFLTSSGAVTKIKGGARGHRFSPRTVLKHGKAACIGTPKLRGRKTGGFLELIGEPGPPGLVRDCLKN